MKTSITFRFLYQISRHLSSRKDCSKIEYRVVIQPDRSVHIYPDVYVYPNRYMRHRSQRISVTEHVLREHINYFDFIRRSVPGVYVYQISSTKRKRRWISKGIIVKGEYEK